MVGCSVLSRSHCILGFVEFEKSLLHERRLHWGTSAVASLLRYSEMKRNNLWVAARINRRVHVRHFYRRRHYPYLCPYWFFGLWYTSLRAKGTSWSLPNWRQYARWALIVRCQGILRIRVPRWELGFLLPFRDFRILQILFTAWCIPIVDCARRESFRLSLLEICRGLGSYVSWIARNCWLFVRWYRKVFWSLGIWREQFLYFSYTGNRTVVAS